MRAAHKSERSRRTLGAITSGATALAALCFLWLAALAGFDVALVVITAVLLSAAAIASAPWRPAPALGGLIAAGVCLGGPFFQPFSQYHLTHPEEYTPFALTVAIVVAGVVALVAGLAAALARPSGGTPGWTASFVSAAVGLLVGALLVGWGVQSTVGAATVQAAATVALAPLAFEPAAVRIAAGSSVTMRDAPDGVPHVLANGSWEDGRAAPARLPGAPPLEDIQVGDGDTLAVGPYGEPGTYPVFCTIHPGMEMAVEVGQ
jgi:plastocyanin